MPSTTYTSYRVTCEDGQVRHDGDYAHLRDALAFAEWGHCCTSRHLVTRTADNVSAVLTGDELAEWSYTVQRYCPECPPVAPLMVPNRTGEVGDDSYYCPACGQAWSLDLSTTVL